MHPYSVECKEALYCGLLRPHSSAASHAIMVSCSVICILCFSEQLSREEVAQAMGVGLKYSDNNRLWLTVYTRSFVSCPIRSAFKGLCLSSLDNCSENYNIVVGQLCHLGIIGF